MSVRIVVMVAAMLFSSGAARGQGSDVTERISVQIAAQNLDSALQTLGRLRELRIVFVSEDLANLKTPGLQGILNDKEALQALLRGTSLTFQFLDARTVSIIPVGLTVDPSDKLDSAAQIRRKPSQSDAGDDAAGLAELTVTADRLLTENVLKAKLYQFARSHSRPSTANAHLARWYEGICPQTSGLSPALNAFVSDRIKDIARTAGTPVGTEKNCKVPNVEVMFTTEPQKLMNNVAGRFQGLLGFPFQAKVRKLATVERPIQSWYATVTRAPDAGLVASSPNWEVDHASEPDPSIKTGTRLPATVITALINVLVVADVSKVMNQRPEALADYIAMLSLSQYQPVNNCDELPSVTQLMSSTCSPAQMSLTAGDAAYLRGLYSADLTQPIQTEVADLVNRMFRELGAEQVQAPHL
jgi:hypothetical protein